MLSGLTKITAEKAQAIVDGRFASGGFNGTLTDQKLEASEVNDFVAGWITLNGGGEAGGLRVFLQNYLTEATQSAPLTIEALKEIMKNELLNYYVEDGAKNIGRVVDGAKGGVVSEGERAAGVRQAEAGADTRLSDPAVTPAVGTQETDTTVVTGEESSGVQIAGAVPVTRTDGDGDGVTVEEGDKNDADISIGSDTKSPTQLGNADVWLTKAALDTDADSDGVTVREGDVDDNNDERGSPGQSPKPGSGEAAVPPPLAGAPVTPTEAPVLPAAEPAVTEPDAGPEEGKMTGPNGGFQAGDRPKDRNVLTQSNIQAIESWSADKNGGVVDNEVTLAEINGFYNAPVADQNRYNGLSGGAAVGGGGGIGTPTGPNGGFVAGDQPEGRNVLKPEDIQAIESWSGQGNDGSAVDGEVNLEEINGFYGLLKEEQAPYYGQRALNKPQDLSLNDLGIQGKLAVNHPDSAKIIKAVKDLANASPTFKAALKYVVETQGAGVLKIGNAGLREDLFGQAKDDTAWMQISDIQGGQPGKGAPTDGGGLLYSTIAHELGHLIQNTHAQIYGAKYASTESSTNGNNALGNPHFNDNNDEAPAIGFNALAYMADINREVTAKGFIPLDLGGSVYSGY